MTPLSLLSALPARGRVGDVPDDTAPRGEEPKYARRERERRFLLAAVPDRPVTRTLHIVDRYLTGTRLRLRRATRTPDADSPAAPAVHKLTQKVPGHGGLPGLVTTIYLDTAEYAVVSRLPAAVLRKTRLTMPPLGVDVFEGPLTGLVLAEVEFEDDAAMAAFAPPPEAIAEVTAEPRLSGGLLATTTAAGLAALLDEYGIPPGS
jgi:hypothetical protein